jgi:hypothetical protein
MSPSTKEVSIKIVVEDALAANRIINKLLPNQDIINSADIWIKDRFYGNVSAGSNPGKKPTS